MRCDSVAIMKQDKRYRVYYRTGGTVNFRWQFVADYFPNAEAAQAKAAELLRMGYPALWQRAYLIDRIGLPDTFGPSLAHRAGAVRAS